MKKLLEEQRTLLGLCPSTCSRPCIEANACSLFTDKTMEYQGKLYGKVGWRHILLTLTSDDVDRLEQWKKEAMQVLDKWEKVWVAAGSPGTYGQSKADAVLKFIQDNVQDH